MSSTIDLPTNISDCHNIITSMARDNESLSAKVELLLNRLVQANRKIYGQSSEQTKYIRDEMTQRLEAIKKQKGLVQLELFTDILADLDKYQSEADAAMEEIQNEDVEPKKKRKKTKGRNQHIEELTHLDVVESHHGDDLKKCPDCSSENLTELPTEEVSQLDIIPAKIVVKKSVTHKHVCEDCKAITRGEKPTSPLPKCMACANLLSHIIHSRFDLYIPYYRLSRDFETYGVDISQANLCNWTNAASEDIFTPLYRELTSSVIDTDVIFADETVLKEMAKGKCLQKYLWGYTNPYNKNIVFDYSSRSRKNPGKFLRYFKDGYLITDKYGGYNEICMKNNLHRAFCWVHARRKFHEIIKSSKDPDDLKDVKYIFSLISEMLDNDKKIRDGDSSKILEKRELEIAPQVSNIFQSLETLEKKIGLLKNSVNKAIRYILDNCEEFRTFLLHPEVEPTNNVSERNIRFVTLGRKNWLFAGSARGGRTTAVISSIIASARAYKLNIREYLTYIIENLPKAKISEVKNFLPQNCMQFAAKDTKE